MAAITIQQLFYDAYADSGRIQFEQTGLNPDQIAECQQVYNRMIDSWQLDGEMVSHVARLTFPLIPNKGIYTVGPNGDFDPAYGVSAAGIAGQIPSSYPVRIDRASVIITQDPAQSGPPEYPLRQLSEQEYQAWTLKEQNASWSWCFYVEPAFNSSNGLAILYLLYIPQQANLVALYLEETLPQIDATQDAILYFRPGYYDCIAANLAVRLDRGRGKISPDVRELARTSLSLIKKNNWRPISRSNDMTSHYEWRSNIFQGNRYGQG